MDFNNVRQENINSEGGDVVGRDKIDNRTIFNNHIRPANQYMQDLISKFKEDEKNNCRITDIIDNLNHYSVNIDDDEVFDLQYKLEAGGRSSEYKRAALLKERISKKIKLNEQSEAAQEIYAYVLSQICSDFHLYVKPHLSENTIPNINILIDEKVIKPAMETLGENVLRLLKDDINGMIYFLTGNCHIKWV
ncbi:ABC-three component system protein [Flavobacterium sp. 120]|uniref:ABC-three component system protein n=1 Tax=Flavobacterium sp. 120 TaxID=2135626 RepID=UPI000EABF34C|nr:ABC-three component system protein [Flavobacterium sp. 120]RKS14321.1 hypothetical protein C8C87_1595 [Flavobacterium sp. 120]